MGVTLYCFIFGVVSLRTVANVSIVLWLMSSGCFVSRVKPEAVSISLSSVSFHGRANPGPPPEDQDAASGDSSAVGHLQVSPLNTGPRDPEGSSLPHQSLTGSLCLWQAQHLRRPEGPVAQDAGQEPREPDHDSANEGEGQRSKVVRLLTFSLLFFSLQGGGS